MIAKKKDESHNGVADVFRSMGYTVADSHKHGEGFPDIAIGHMGISIAVNASEYDEVMTRVAELIKSMGVNAAIFTGVTALIEIKTGKGGLSQAEKKWWSVWDGAGDILNETSNFDRYKITRKI